MSLRCDSDDHTGEEFAIDAFMRSIFDFDALRHIRFVGAFPLTQNAMCHLIGVVCIKPGLEEILLPRQLGLRDWKDAWDSEELANAHKAYIRERIARVELTYRESIKSLWSRYREEWYPERYARGLIQTEKVEVSFCLEDVFHVNNQVSGSSLSSQARGASAPATGEVDNDDWPT